MFSALDHAMMARAVRLAERGRYWARPNPHVGCVLADGELVVGEGFTQPPGQAHAEAAALAQAGERARNGPLTPFHLKQTTTFFQIIRTIFILPPRPPPLRPEGLRGASVGHVEGMLRFFEFVFCFLVVK